MSKYHCLKILFKPTNYQKTLIERAFVACTIIYNEFVKTYDKILSDENRYISWMDFDKMWNHELKYECNQTTNELKIRYPIIEEIPSASRSFAEKEAYEAFIKMYKNKHNHPRYKDPNDPKQIRTKLTLIAGNSTSIRMRPYDFTRVHVPYLGYLRLREHGFIKPDMVKYIHSCAIIRHNDKYYVVFYLRDYNIDKFKKPMMNKRKTSGIGIDVGIRSLFTIYGKSISSFPNLLHDKKYIDEYHKFCKLQEIIDNKCIINAKKKGYIWTPKLNELSYKEIDEIYRSGHIMKLRKRAAKINEHLANRRKDYIRKICNLLVRTNPRYITVEKLDVEYLIKINPRNLRRAILYSNLYFIRKTIYQKCIQYGIEYRSANQLYPSSRMCSVCGNINSDLKLEKIFICPKCGFTINRDVNAAINLKNCPIYSNDFK